MADFKEILNISNNIGSLTSDALVPPFSKGLKSLSIEVSGIAVNGIDDVFIRRKFGSGQMVAAINAQEHCEPKSGE